MKSATGTAPNWDDFRFLLTVLREGRFAAAGRALGVEHTTVARRIKVLEESLGAPLFFRTAKGLLPTPLGQGALEKAEAMERAAMDTVASSNRTRGQIEGKVRISVTDSIAARWLVPHLATLWRTHPKLQVEILTNQAHVDLARGSAELAIRTPRPQRRELTAYRLGTTAFRLFASRSIATRAARALRAEVPTTDGLPLVIYTHDNVFLQRAPWFQALLARSPEQMTASSTLVLLEAARAGVGVVVLPDFAVGEERSLVPVSEPLSHHEAWLVSHPEVRRDPRVAAVADFIKKLAPSLQSVADAPTRKKPAKKKTAKRR